MADSAIPTEEEQSDRSWLVVPSWGVSLVVHALIMIFFILGAGSFQGGDPGPTDGDYREVGLYVKNSQENQQEEETNEQPVEQTQPLDTNPVEQSFQPPAETEAPPVELPAFTQSPNVIGPGAASPSSPSSPNPLNDVVRPNQMKAPTGGPAGKGDNSTEFFGIKDRGEVFVWVLDSSSSMAYSAGPGIPSAMAMAKGELMASLSNLKSGQKFQVIFYNKSPNLIGLTEADSGGLLTGTNINLTLANQQIRSIVPRHGTKHMPALRKALTLNPDVIFFPDGCRFSPAGTG